ncbi:hypothetical protein UFOVP1329_30 [uncultured Caudovirales phage]|uniref:Uncharacterized protein n=1 Tax=uncultured Caudovirales phage TaxID=2100421 RepID=A0A6J5RYB6_9CAUD|nr:hypothetical protein UFOVP1150_11 [uncultured Caudovirales phage]CAB4199226.1 hypothetical protein UFOVP1329_30 [uncultured Caudovirales phage]CAB4218260.1 hypothetical protein UFOVP1595_6 [uncultured Caudovirales phage]
MNAATRKTINEMISDLEGLKVQVAEIATQIEDLAGEEREKFDNLTEGLQQAESGQAIEQAAQNLESAASAAGSLDSEFDSLISSLDEASA